MVEGDGDGGNELDGDTMEKVKNDLAGNDGGRQHGRGQASYHKYLSKG